MTAPATRFESRRRSYAAGLLHLLEAHKPQTDKARAEIARRLALVETTIECPRINVPNEECPLCGAIDGRHDHHDRPSECRA